MRILVVEDDSRLAPLLEQGLREDGYRVTVARNGPDALDLGRLYEFDLIVLDLMLPGLDGFEVTRRLRAAGRMVPILMLTARDTNPDIVRGLDAGADDYLTKPFSFDVFLARVRAGVRRGPAPLAAVLEAGDLVLDRANHEVRQAGARIPLSRTEYCILEMLFRRRGHVVPREDIIDEVWGCDREVENNTLDAFMKILRSKVDPNPDCRRIQTIRGVGYRLRTEREPE